MMGFWGHGWGMVLVMVVFWALVLGGGFWLLASLFPAGRAAPPREGRPDAAEIDPAVQVVRQRYASGEITQDEYEQLLQVLGRGAPRT